MKIKKLTIKEAKQIISKLVDENRAFENERDTAYQEIDKKFPIKYGEDNPERDKAFDELNKKYWPDYKSKEFDNPPYLKIHRLTESETPIAEDKQCCQNCIVEAFCTKRRYVSNSYYVCSDYSPTSPYMFGFNKDIQETLIASCEPKTKRQEVSKCLENYKKLLEYAKECENAVVEEIKPLPEEAYKKAEDYHNKAERVKKEWSDCWEPSKTKLCGLDTLTFNTEKAQEVFKKEGACPMSFLFGPIVNDKDKVDFKGSLNG